MDEMVIRERLENLFIYSLKNKKIKHRSCKAIDQSYFRFKKRLLKKNCLTWNALYWKTSLKVYNYHKVKVDYSEEVSRDEFEQAICDMFIEDGIHDSNRMKNLFDKWKMIWLLQGLLPVNAVDWKPTANILHNPVMKIYQGKHANNITRQENNDINIFHSNINKQVTL